MGSLHHLLCPDEAAVLGCLRDLLRFHEGFDHRLLESAERALHDLCGPSARTIVSQGVFLVRILDEDGVPTGGLPTGAGVLAWRRASEEELGLLALIEAAQSSRTRLETLLKAAAWPTPELVFVMIRFGALLLSAGLRLPRRAPLASRPAAPAFPTAAHASIGLHVT